MTWVAFAVAVCALAALFVREYRRKKELEAMDRLLDIAIAGDFSPDTFDETQVSKLGSKLYRYMTSAKLRRGQLEEEQARVRAMISDISHQTKTPVANILLYTELLSEQPEPSEQSRALISQTHAGAEKLSFLISALVKSSRLESGIIQIEPENRDLYSLAITASADCLPKAREKNITLKLPDENPSIRALYDPKWCSEAVYNIIDNAVKYTPGGGRIEITLHDYEMFACIRVADTGKGIAEADLPQIFSRFYRSSDSSESEGVGIGLCLAREIVTRCGGYIQAESKPGRGSTFSVFLSKL